MRNRKRNLVEFAVVDEPIANLNENDQQPADREDVGADVLVQRVYAELYQLCRKRLAQERPRHTLHATALLNEVYVRLALDDGRAFRDRQHFLAVASRVIRQVLVDHARARGSQKRGGGKAPVALTDLSTFPASGGSDVDLLDLDSALEELAELSSRQATIIEMHYFGGLSQAEIGEAVGLSERSVRSELSVSRAWLARRLGGSRA